MIKLLCRDMPCTCPLYNERQAQCLPFYFFGVRMLLQRLYGCILLLHFVLLSKVLDSRLRENDVLWDMCLLNIHGLGDMIQTVSCGGGVVVFLLNSRTCRSKSLSSISGLISWIVSRILIMPGKARDVLNMRLFPFLSI